MKKLIALALMLLMIVPVVALSAGAVVEKGLALDKEYILTNDETVIEMPDDPTMTEEEVEDWIAKQEEEKKAAEEAAGEEGILTSAAALAMAPNYHIMYDVDTETKILNIYVDPEYKNPNYNGANVQEMLQYARARWIPWSRNYIRRNIETAYIKEGVLRVGHYSFYECANLKTVYLPQSIHWVDRTVFYQCASLENIYYPGTKEDFEKNVIWIDSFNTLDKAGTIRAYDKLHFGEHVTVECKTESGHMFTSYTVGGYNVGDEYTITPKSFDNMELLGTSEYTGKFKKGDETVYTFTYKCEHEYEVEDPEKPCGSYCKHCGEADPSSEHTWTYETVSERSFIHEEKIVSTCTVCGATHTNTQYAYFWYALIGGAALALVSLLLAAIIAPIKRRRKIKRMSW